MSHITEIREAIGKALAEVAPDAQVYPGPTEYGKSQGIDQEKLMVRVLVGPQDDPKAQARLDELLERDGETSVRAAIAAAGDFDGLVMDATVTACTGYRTYPPQNDPVLGAEWVVTTLTEGGS